MKKITAFLTSISLILCGCSDSTTDSSKSSEVYTRDIFAMDTYMSIRAYGENAEQGLGKSAERIINLEKLLSVTDEESDIWAVNHSNGEKTLVSDDTLNIINKAIEIGEKSNGALDISIYPVLKEWGFTSDEYKIPDSDTLNELLNNVDFRKIEIEENAVIIPPEFQIDLGSLTKGYTSDIVIEILRDSGVESAIVDLGGNVQTLGTKPDGEKWKVAVKNPFNANEHIGVLSVSDKAVITSGSYERYFVGDDGNNYWHIIDSSDGYPADNGLVSVTIIGESGLLCDALSTALFVLGKDKAIEYWKENSDFNMVLVTDNAEIYVTEGIESSFVNASGLTMEIVRND